MSTAKATPDQPGRFVWITPARARELMERNNHSRTIKQPAVDRYVLIMKRLYKIG